MFDDTRVPNLGSPAARTHRGRPLAAWALLAALLFLGATATVGGALLLAAPDGRLLGLPTTVLAGSPFADFLVPGLALFGVLGVGSLVVSYGLFAARWWAWPGAVAVGLAVGVWFTVQARVLGWGHWLQWFYLLLGVAVLLLAATDAVRQYVGVDERASSRDRR